MATKIVSVKARVPASTLGGWGNVDLEDKETRRRLGGQAQNHLRNALSGSDAQEYNLRDLTAKYTRKGNVRAEFLVDVPSSVSDTQVQSRVIETLNPLSQRAGAERFDVQVADLDA